MTLPPLKNIPLTPLINDPLVRGICCNCNPCRDSIFLSIHRHRMHIGLKLALHQFTFNDYECPSTNDCEKVSSSSPSDKFQTALPLFVQLWFMPKSLIQWCFHESVFFPDMIQHQVKMNTNIITNRFVAMNVFWVCQKNINYNVTLSCRSVTLWDYHQIEFLHNLRVAFFLAELLLSRQLPVKDY